MSDHYCYAGSETLINKFNEKNFIKLQLKERAITEARIAQILSSPEIVINGWGINTLSRIHKAIFSDIYQWAGKLRDIDIGKDGLGFCYHDEIKSNLTRAKNDIDNLKIKNLSDFVRYASAIHAVLNSIHPFREGNGRTIRTFLTLFARTHGYDLNYNWVPKKQQLDADIFSLAKESDTSGLVVLYSSITSDYIGAQKIRIINAPKITEPIVVKTCDNLQSSQNKTQKRNKTSSSHQLSSLDRKSR